MLRALQALQDEEDGLSLPDQPQWDAVGVTPRLRQQNLDAGFAREVTNGAGRFQGFRVTPAGKDALASADAEELLKRVMPAWRAALPKAHRKHLTAYLSDAKQRPALLALLRRYLAGALTPVDFFREQLEELAPEIARDRAYRNARANSFPQNARIELDAAFKRVFVPRVLTEPSRWRELNDRYFGDEEFRRAAGDVLFDMTADAPHQEAGKSCCASCAAHRPCEGSCPQHHEGER